MERIPLLFGQVAPREVRCTYSPVGGGVLRVRYHRPAGPAPVPVVNVAQLVELLVVVQAAEGSSPSVHP